jgi:hemerythrin-like domain-containing protein
MDKAGRVIRNEHRSISAVLHALQHLARMAQGPGEQPRFEVFRAIIHYIGAFPERMHHPKEEKHLFARLEARAPEAAPLVEELRAEHVSGAQLVRDLEQALRAFEGSRPGAAGAFAAAVNSYADFHWSHMRKEEDQLLPLARKHLTAADWSAIDDAFAGNDDPIADLRAEDFAQLFSRLVNLIPEPFGLGERSNGARP